ncbi:TBC1 domain family member 13-like isoform X2 [Carica papaya]|uniref:TBC1 domain family member 13-like isoform X2 n=1 Tax=Carica papaya TaxID=3649 RepID=UPI000B8CED04|nr:TBC1 domain family member 13-like isoform X2 [Carica papaya]
MLKGKLKLPDRLGNLVVDFEDRDDKIGGSSSVLASSEELEIILPNGLGFSRHKDDGDGLCCTEEKKTNEAAIFRASARPYKDRAGSVSAMAFIAADEKRSDFEYQLSRKEINVEKLQRIASTGFPDGGGMRATAWKLLLGYLPPSRDLWEKELTKNRQNYAKLKEELLLSPSELKKNTEEELSSSKQNVDGDSDGLLRRHEISSEDHPLSLGKASVWNQYFQHMDIIEQIDRDLKRTHPEMEFFSGDTSFSRKNREAMKNILLLFAKLNPAIRYVQGMHEVLAPIYYVFCTDIDEKNVANAEADSFSCFVKLLSDSVDHFCQQLDNSSGGILSTLSRMSELLKANDEELWRHLELTSRVKAQYYAFRWITLFLTQEFNLQSVLRIWDSLLSNPFGIQSVYIAPYLVASFGCRRCFFASVVQCCCA